MHATVSAPRTAGHRVDMRVMAAVCVGCLAIGLKSAQLLSEVTGPVDTAARQGVLVVIALLCTWGVVGAGTLRVAGLVVPSTTPPGAARGMVVAGSAVVILSLTALAAGASSAEVLRILVATALAEEIIFRGVIFGLVADRRAAYSTVLGSVLFGLWHIPDSAGSITASVVALGCTVAASAVLFIPARRWTGTIYLAAALHACINLAGTAISMTGSQ